MVIVPPCNATVTDLKFWKSILCFVIAVCSERGRSKARASSPQCSISDNKSSGWLNRTKTTDRRVRFHLTVSGKGTNSSRLATFVAHKCLICLRVILAFRQRSARRILHRQVEAAPMADDLRYLQNVCRRLVCSAFVSYKAESLCWKRMRAQGCSVDFGKYFVVLFVTSCGGRKKQTGFRTFRLITTLWYNV